MFKRIKRLWERIYIGVYPIYQFGKKVFFVGVFVLFVLSCFFYFEQSKGNDVERNMNIALDKKWAVEQNDSKMPYLAVHFTVNEIPYVFEKEDMVKIVQKRLQLHNYQVRADRNNAANGWVVKYELNYADTVRAFYTTDVAVKGKVAPTLWLLSSNYITKYNLEERLKGYEIPIPE